MARPERIESLEDVRVWIADHDGRIDAWWDQQHRWNTTIDEKISTISQRMTAVEKKIAVIAAVAAAGGSVAGSVLNGLF